MQRETKQLVRRLVRSVFALGALVAAAASAGELIQAVESGDGQSVRALLEAGAALDEAQADGTTALHVAALRDDLEIADLLLAAGADVHAATRYGVTPLALAAANGSAPMLRRLLEAGADPNETSREGQTALMSAALNGRIEALDVLIAHGADVNAVEPFRGQTALMWAAGAGQAAAVERLVAAGADVAARSHGGFTALLFAVRENRIEAARQLLEHGANVEDHAPDGTTALNMAVVNAYYDLAAMLLDFGADPNAPDPRGSALHTVAWLHKPGSTWDAAALSAEPETAPRPTGRVTALELARKLLEHGADPNIRARFEEQRFTKGLGTTMNPPGLMLGRHYLTYNGATPFYVAARNGDYRLMALLAEFGADATIPNVGGVTPLMAAAGLDYYEGETPGPFVGVPEAERLEAVKLALELGNDINAHTDFGDYPMLGGPEFTLLTYPLNFDDLDELGMGDPRFDGMTALHGAVISNQPSIVRYLIDQGADVNATNTLGWTPLMVAEGIFLANAKKEFPAAAEMLREAEALAAR
ncbi:MAG TPA: ankyrin repeat domain-containing protein [Gammaproteobacteria bacterium]